MSYFLAVLFIGYMTVSMPMEMVPGTQPRSEESEEDLVCGCCHDTIPPHDNHFKYNDSYLVCIHCYFYRIPRVDGAVGLEYVYNNGKDLKK